MSTEKPHASDSAAPEGTDLPVKEKIQYLGRGVVAPDRPTRWGSQIFWISLVGLLVSITMAWMIRHQAQVERERALQPTEDEIARQTLVQKQRLAIESLKERSIELGQFNVQILAVAPPHPGVLNTASIEITLECDQAEVCGRIKSRVAQARNEVIGVFRPIDREDLFSKDGKKRLKRLIQDRINHWIGSESGRVAQVHFINVLVL